MRFRRRQAADIMVFVAEGDAGVLYAPPRGWVVPGDWHRLGSVTMPVSDEAEVNAAQAALGVHVEMYGEVV